MLSKISNYLFQIILLSLPFIIPQFHIHDDNSTLLTAVSLLFAIQEFKPYQFYVLDEIDAALDKRNSERLAALLNQYMKSGQYIVISHNDAIILNSQLLYGISMHEGVSKILSLHLDGEKKEN